MRTKSAVICILLLFGLSACGGGNDGSASKSASTSSTSAPVPTATTATAPPPAADGKLVGTWAGTYVSKKFSSTQGKFTVAFTQDGSTLSGTIKLSAACITSGTVSGTITGDKLDFGAVKGQGRTVSFTGSVAGDKMHGSYTSDASCGNDKGRWTASRS